MKRNRTFLVYPLLIMGVALLLSSCKKDENYNVPMVTTTAVTGIDVTTAVSGGNVTSDGGAAITARGVCWNNSQNPTVSDSKTANGTGTGNFISNLTNLVPGRTYYVRAYATNSIGTGYGNEVSFTIPIPADGTTSTLTYNGYTYKTVYINGKEWLAENLQTTKYKDGTPIANVTDDTEWDGLSTGAYCWYNNDETANKNTYGALYNWHAVNTGKLAPAGWHVPTDAEWTALTDYLGGTTVAGGKLKEIGTAHWGDPNTDATNEVGFTALPGGSRHYGGSFDGIGDSGYWWSATESGAYSAWYRYMNYDISDVLRNNYYRELGFSVRCVRD